LLSRGEDKETRDGVVTERGEVDGAFSDVGQG